MVVHFCTESGVGKKQSEDRVLAGAAIYSEYSSSISLNRGFVAVADGVGGNSGGSVASDMVCSALAREAEPSMAVFSSINDSIISRGFSDQSLCNMATTLSGIWFGNNQSKLFHVGNTRIYSIQAGCYLSLLTEDDTLVNYLEKTGQLSEEEALTFPGRNEITACFGGGRHDLLKLEFTDVDYDEYSVFLITSDGVHEYLSIDEMEDIISAAHGDWNASVSSLVHTAKERGSLDDCTAVIIQCGKGE